MRHGVRNIFIRLILCTALALVLPALALGESSPIPGMGREAFDAALAGDRLTLRPVENVGFDPAADKPLSISPDGTKLLLLSEGGLTRYTLSDGKTQALVPRAGESNLTEERIAQQFAEVEAGCVSWSPDDSGLVISFPGWVYRNIRFDANIWAADFESGDIVPLFALPVDLFKDMELHDASVPVRSAFDPEELLLYYECFGEDPADPEKSWKSYFYRYDMSTKETDMVGNTLYDMASGDGNLWVTDGRLVTTVGSNSGPKGGAGMAVLVPGRDAEMTLEREGVLADFLHGSRLIAGHGDTGVLLFLPSWQNVSFLPKLLQFTVSSEGKAVWDRFLLLAPDLPAEKRLVSVDADAQSAEEEREAYAEHVNQGGILAPCNAAYSPYGNYLLLGASDTNRGEAALYVLNVVDGTCGRIALPEGMQVDSFTYGFGPNRLPGMVWAEDNRLLLRDGDVFRLFELGT